MLNIFKNRAKNNFLNEWDNLFLEKHNFTSEDYLNKKHLLLKDFLSKNYNYDLNENQQKELHLILNHIFTEFKRDYHSYQDKNYTLISVDLYKTFLEADKIFFYFWQELGLCYNDKKEILKFLVNNDLSSEEWRKFGNPKELLPFCQYIIECIFDRKFNTKTQKNISVNNNFDYAIAFALVFVDELNIDFGFSIIHNAVKNGLEEQFLLNYFYREKYQQIKEEVEMA